MCSIVPDPSCTAVTIVKVKHLFLTGFNVCGFFVDVVWVREWSFDEEGTGINEATVSLSSIDCFEQCGADINNTVIR